MGKTVATTYNVAADDVIFTKLLTKVCKLTVGGFLPSSSISKGKGLLALNMTHNAFLENTVSFQQRFTWKVFSSHQAECCSGSETIRFGPRVDQVRCWEGASQEFLH